VADSRPPDLHERTTRTCIARKLAKLKGYEFAGDYDSAKRYRPRLYFVPDDTLTAVEARQLGIRDEHDLFGGVVPYAFVATKAITHPLVDFDACAPEGWRRDIGDQLRDSVLFGFTAFSREDAQKAGILVLERGPARVKPVHAMGGRGQTVVCKLGLLANVIDGLNPSDLSRYGVVLEQNFDAIVTYSVGQVRLGELLATYYGI
jgi:hypothetical protein